ncbi:Vitamin B12 import ATP-binding protein BtuD [Arenibacter antarcticus]|uniref:Sulfate/molybdate ABC transporter ATP-binding protein n=1 Tax=Arenibacter antarcticus TaxID=2040469 RepID=A0ABW5VDC1_9FLAO|nr:ATP-binding cassette domain-containing protein [Arenibacter sp. H213]MCM4169433.1 molybdenum ABC transporter ATP-binding protein [Arenibacter sp. H213]
MIEISLSKKLQSSGGSMLLDLELKIEKGQFVTLYGVSGAGKTCTLRLLSGLLTPDKGRIVVHGTPWFDGEKKINLPPQQRKLGYVFQDYALFPNMTVRENLEFALQKGQPKSIVRELVDIVELGEFLDRNPSNLSGGQQQRVALARALVQRPEILILDEPLSALDHKMRFKLQEYLLKVHSAYNLTTILVSHNIGEIVKLSDFVYELHNGRVIREGKALEFFSSERSSAKFRFTGEVIQIEEEEVIYVVSVLVGNSVVKVVSDREEALKLKLGDQVFVASKAFNPLIERI